MPSASPSPAPEDAIHTHGQRIGELGDMVSSLFARQFGGEPEHVRALAIAAIANVLCYHLDNPEMVMLTGATIERGFDRRAERLVDPSKSH